MFIQEKSNICKHLLMFKDNRRINNFKCFKVIYKGEKGIEYREWEKLNFFQYTYFLDLN